MPVIGPTDDLGILLAFDRSAVDLAPAKEAANLLNPAGALFS